MREMTWSRSLICLLVLIIYVPVNNFQSCWYVSWFEPEDRMSCSMTQPSQQVVLDGQK